MKKALVVMMALALLFAMGGMALAKQEPAGAPGNIVANEYSLGYKDWNEREQGVTTGKVFTGYGSSTHLRGTWNSPYTTGVDGYNYNDAQDYTKDGTQVGSGGTYNVQYPIYGPGYEVYNFGTMTMPNMRFESGPHGGYLTSTHRCRECHAVHRAAGKFKLLRSDTRFEACDWCHGTGAGSGFNIQMDNDDAYTTEYNVGHTMGFGISGGKWKAPDDTYPAFTPNFWQGGFSCFDCHSPHANPARLMGYDAKGVPIPSIVDTTTGMVYNIGNPGHDMFTKGGKGFSGENTTTLQNMGYFVPALGMPLPKAKPYYLAGSWLLIKNPDREIATINTTVTSGIESWVPNVDPSKVNTADFVKGGSFVRDPDITITAGQEIPDAVSAKLLEFDTSTPYPVNKVPTDWNNPIGSASLWDEDFRGGAPDMPAPNTDYGYDARNPFCRSLILDEFCTDCHDGNAGFHTAKAPLFSEDRALRGQGAVENNWRGNYDLAYGHDVNVRH
ncbi:MAG: hypothetical protein KGZ93_02300 [Actinobacteria bacterium]|nr:hypothetical protein [Actinomycetota bacterium]